MMLEVANDVALWIVGISGAAVSSWAVIKYKVDQLDKQKHEDHSTMWQKIHEMEQWKETHEHNMANQIMLCERRMGGHDTAMAKRDAQYEEIIHRLDEMKISFDRRLERLESKLER